MAESATGRERSAGDILNYIYILTLPQKFFYWIDLNERQLYEPMKFDAVKWSWS